MSAADSESAPLLRSEESSPAERRPSESSGDTKWDKTAIWTAVLTTTVLVLFAFADLLKYVSTIRLLELGLCREYYLENDPSLVDDNGNVSEDVCKLPEIQQSLAHLRGYMSALESTIGLLLTIPYGLLIGRLGECFLAGMDLIGYLLSCAWLLVVCVYWSTFPTWTAGLSPLLRIVGGGSPFFSSLVYSIVAKHVPESKRALCYFVFFGAQTITSTISMLTAAALLDRGHLYMPLMLNFPVGLLCLLALLAIHIVTSKDPASHKDQETRDIPSIKSSIHSLVNVLRDTNVVALLATVPVAKSISPIGELTWQYIPKRFRVSLSDASRALTIPSIETLILLLIVFPRVKSIVLNRFNITSNTIDLYIVQFGFVIHAIGCLVMAASPTLILFVTGILVSTLGCSARPALQAVLAGFVAKDHVAILFTIVAVADGVGSAAGAVVLNWAFSLALGWENSQWLGFPFVLAAAFFFGAWAVTVFVAYRTRG